MKRRLPPRISVRSFRATCCFPCPTKKRRSRSKRQQWSAIRTDSLSGVISFTGKQRNSHELLTANFSACGASKAVGTPSRPPRPTILRKRPTDHRRRSPAPCQVARLRAVRAVAQRVAGLEPQAFTHLARNDGLALDRTLEKRDGGSVRRFMLGDMLTGVRRTRPSKSDFTATSRFSKRCPFFLDNVPEYDTRPSTSLAVCEGLSAEGTPRRGARAVPADGAIHSVRRQFGNSPGRPRRRSARSWLPGWRTELNPLALP